MSTAPTESELDAATNTSTTAGSPAMSGGKRFFTVWITRSELSDDHGRDSAKASVDEARPGKDDGRLPGPPLDAASLLDEVLETPDKPSADDSILQRIEGSETTLNDGGALPSGSDEALSSLQLPALIVVRRAPSASRPGSCKLFYPADPGFQHLPHGDNGDGIRNPHPNEVEDKFWAQRKRLFSRFDEGIQMDAESWYSVTPEEIAKHIARRMASGDHGANVILDAFGGVAGNTIALCLQGGVDRVVCVDTDESKLLMAANNCKIYGVPPQKVLLVHANACHVLRAYKNGLRIAPAPSESNNNNATGSLGKIVHGFTVASSLDLLPPAIHGIFLSPPWGGTDVVEEAGRKGFGLESIQVDGGDCERSIKVDGEAVLRFAYDALPSGDKRLAYYLPRSTNGKKVAMSAIEAGFRDSLELEGNILNCKLKTTTAYFGSLVVPR
jgi:trimethylguanosine synthase